MKIRADFVTNSSSSSYCTLAVTLKNGKSIDWCGIDGEAPVFVIPLEAKKMISEVKNIEDLILFVKKCAEEIDDEDVEDIFSNRCRDFETALKTLSGIEEVSKFSLAWGEYMADQGERPADGCEGESLEYDFETQNCKIEKVPDKEFVNKMIDLYGE